MGEVGAAKLERKKERSKSAFFFLLRGLFPCDRLLASRRRRTGGDLLDQKAVVVVVVLRGGREGVEEKKVQKSKGFKNPHGKREKATNDEKAR